MCLLLHGALQDLCLHRGPKVPAIPAPSLGDSSPRVREALTSFEAESEAAKAQEELDAEADGAPDGSLDETTPHTLHRVVLGVLYGCLWGRACLQ